MSKLSKIGASSRDDEIEALSILLNGVNTALVGMTTYFPPTSKDGSIDPSWVPYEGQTIARSAVPALWERVKQLDVVVSDAAWLALRAASPNGAVAVYSSGDGSTTMRMPTTGDDGGFMRSVGTDPVLNALHDFKKGFQDQIQNITGEFNSLKHSSHLKNSGIVSSERIGNSLNWLGTTPSLNLYKMTIDASRMARTGDETHPKGMYGKLYVYAGNVTTNLPVPTPDWLAQQNTNTQEIAKLQRYPTEWIVIGSEGAPQYESGLSAPDDLLGLTYRFSDAQTIEVIGSVSGFINLSMPAFTFPSDIAQRINTSQSSPASINHVTGTMTSTHMETLVEASTGVFNLCEYVASGSGGRMSVNHKILLDF